MSVIFEVNRLPTTQREYRLEQNAEACAFRITVSRATPLLDLKFAVSNRFKDAIVMVDGCNMTVAYTYYAKDGCEYLIRRMHSFIEGFLEGWKADEAKPPMPSMPSFFVVTYWHKRGKPVLGYEEHFKDSAETAGKLVFNACCLFSGFDGVQVFSNGTEFLYGTEAKYHKVLDGHQLELPSTLNLEGSIGARYGKEIT